VAGRQHYTMQRPTDDRFGLARHNPAKHIAMLMGGRASEELAGHHHEGLRAGDYHPTRTERRPRRMQPPPTCPRDVERQINSQRSGPQRDNLKQLADGFVPAFSLIGSVVPKRKEIQDD